MLKSNKIQADKTGFTIVELMVATSVFALVLLVALTGFLQIGRVFYKGVSDTQTQDVLRQVVNDISDNIMASSQGVSLGNTTTPAYNYLCAGPYRYTSAKYDSGGSNNGQPVRYNSDSNPIFDPTKSTVNMGLIKDWVGTGNCPVPCIASSTNADVRCPPSNFLALDPTSPYTELLGNGMRVGSISLKPSVDSSGKNLPIYNLAVTIIYGDDSVLDFTTTPASCVGGLSNHEFCSVNQSNTSVFEGGLHP
jgi:prepilin-type N-terminal cleavage/methylation domain-containing protein